MDIYIPSTENELKNKLESYNMDEVAKQQEKIEEETWEKLKKAHRDTMLSLIWGYILNKNIDISNINITWTKISFKTNNDIDTGIDNLSLDDIKMWIKMDFINRYFPEKNWWVKIEKKFASDFKTDFEDKAKEKKAEFDNDLEKFRKYLIEKDYSNEKVYNIMETDELKTMWASVQYDLITNHNMNYLIESTSWMEKLLWWLDVDWTNWKSLKENWEKANWLLKTWATIGWIFLLYKSIMWIWNHKDNPLKWKFWKSIWVGLVWELIWQVYTWRSFLWEWVWSISSFLWWESNLKTLKKQHEELNNNENGEIKDYTWLFLLTLWQRSKDEVLWDFDFVNENSRDPIIQTLITKAKERWENIGDIKEKLEKGRDDFLKKALEDLWLWVNLSIADLMDIGWTGKLSDKVNTLLERKKELKEADIIKQIRDKWITKSDEVIIQTLKINDIAENYIKIWNPVIEINLSPVWKPETININI